MRSNTATAGLVLALTVAATGCDFSPSLEAAVSVRLEGVPATAVAGQPISFTATIVTAKGEPVTRYQGEVRVSTAHGPGPTSGTTSVTAVKGVASFTDVRLTSAGGHRLEVQPQPYEAAQVGSNRTRLIDVQAAAAQKLGLAQQPGRSAQNGLIYPFPTVEVQDEFGNRVPTGSAEITAALGTNPGSATLTGPAVLTAAAGTAVFDGLRLDQLGTGYVLLFTAPGLESVASNPFDVAVPRLTYTDPPSGTGKVRLVRNAASTDTVAVLDLVAAEQLQGFAVGFNLPYDARTVRPAATLLTVGSAIDPGAAPPAAAAAMPASGPLAGVLTAGISQKASGTGAVPGDTTIPAGAVLFTLNIALADAPIFAPAFDGAALGEGFAAALRDRTGTDVVRGVEFAFGRLAVE